MPSPSKNTNLMLLAGVSVLLAFAFWLLLNTSEELDAMREDENLAVAAASKSSPHVAEAGSRARDRASPFPSPENLLPMAEKGRIFLDPTGLGIVGRVVVEETGGPVPGAVVSASPLTGNEKDPGQDPGPFKQTLTDAAGRFSLSGIKESRVSLHVTHPDYVDARVIVDAEKAEEVEIRLEAGYCLFGKAFDDTGSPAEGIEIRFPPSGSKVLLARTETDGSYRTRPIKTERLLVMAEAPEQGEYSTVPFTRETRRVEIVDHDMEVNFGPSADQVTWRGTVYGFEDQVLKDAEMRAHLRTLRNPDVAILSLGPWTSRTDAQGRFEIRKMVCGNYSVVLSLPDQRTNASITNISLDRPGIVEQDVRLSQCSCRIFGRVVMEDSGLPPRGRTVHIWALEESNLNRQATVNPETGDFSFPLIEAGKWQLGARETREDIDRNYVSGIRSEATVGLNQGDVIRDLILALPSAGILHLQLLGFTPNELGSLDIFFHSEQGSSFPTFRWDGNVRLYLTPGRWSLLLSLAGGEVCTRVFSVLSEETTEGIIRRGDLSHPGRIIRVAGTLCGAEVGAIAGATLNFDRLSRTLFECRTDDRGRFSLEGLMPGYWSVFCRVTSNRNMHLTEIFIPQDAADPFPLDLVLPAGGVRGMLLDSRGGPPFHDSAGESWKIQLLQGNESFSEATVPPESHFEIEGVHGGDYSLRVEVPGYRPYSSSIFSLAEGEIKDLGRILLTPCGLLNIEVKDVSGGPVEEFRLVYNQGLWDKTQFVWTSAGPGRRQYANLPLGPVEVKIRARGYKTQKAHVVLEPARPVFLSFVLDRSH